MNHRLEVLHPDIMLPSKADADAFHAGSSFAGHEERAAEPRWERIAGMAMLAAAIGIATIAIANSDESKGPSRELTPYPDACEYFAMARAMQQGTYPSIIIGGERLPSRYQPGYAVAMQPWLHVLPEPERVAAPIRVSQCAGLAIILVMFSCLRSQGMTLAAGLCALLVATLPWCVTYARAPLSDCLSAAFIAAACAATFQGNTKNSTPFRILAAILLGAAVTVRLQNVILAPLLIAIPPGPMPLFAALRQSALRSALPAIAFTATLVPMLALNSMLFGSLLKSGYDFWVPGSVSLTPNMIPKALAMLWREASLTAADYSAAHQYGTGAQLTPAYLVLAAIGLPRLRFSRATYPIIAALACYLLLCLMYRFQDLRFYGPILLAASIPAAIAAATAIAQLSRGRQNLGGGLVCACLALAFVGYPSQVDYPRRGWESQLPYTLGLRPHRDQYAPSRWNAVRELIAVADGAQSVVISDINAVYLSSLLPRTMRAVPLDMTDSGYVHSRAWRFDPATSVAAICDRADRGDRVYAAILTGGAGTDVSRLPPIDGHAWSLVPQTGTPARIYRLHRHP